jgi:hypothetical protein
MNKRFARLKKQSNKAFYSEDHAELAACTRGIHVCTALAYQLCLHNHTSDDRFSR